MAPPKHVRIPAAVELTRLEGASRTGPISHTTPEHSSDAELSLSRRKLIQHTWRTVSSLEGLISYSVHGASPVEDTQAAGFIERVMHSETYNRHPHVRSVMHSHPEDVVAYSIAAIPFRACSHMAGFRGACGAPMFDIADHTGAQDLRDIPVYDARLSAALAAGFDHGSVVALMCGHGFTTVGSSIESAVLQAVQARKNAIMSSIM